MGNSVSSLTPHAEENVGGSFHIASRDIAHTRIKNITLTQVGPIIHKHAQSLGFSASSAAQMKNWFAAQFATHVKFAHLYVEARDASAQMFLHGFGCDPVTGRVVSADSSKPTQLKMFVLPPEEHAQDLRISGVDQVRTHPLRDHYKLAASQVFGRMLDVAQAVNDAELKYVGANQIRWSNPVKTPPPTNSNAAAQACLEYAELITRPEEVKVVLHSHRWAPGFRRNLLKELKIGTLFEEMASRGATIADLGERFRRHMPWVPEEPSSALQSVMASPALALT